MRWRTVLVVLGLVLSGCTAQPPPAPTESGPSSTSAKPAVEVYELASRPELAPPKVTVRDSRDGLDPGYVFLMARFGEREKGDDQAYAVVVDQSGELVWAKRFPDDGSFPNDLAVQTYRGRQVLTYWRGSSPERGWGNGEYVILDTSYREIATVSTGNGYHADFHDLEITPRGTAYLMSYPTVRGNPDVREGVIQEVDIATGRVLFEWHSIDHIGLEESTAPPPDEGEAFDYIHLNSVDESADGDLLVSARHTRAIYKIDRGTGEVEWTMGGSHNDFRLGEGVEFAWQHDARWLPDGRISLLDNTSNLDSEGGPSRALTLEVDETERTADLVSEYVNPDGETSGSQASHRVLPSGNSVVGWGSVPAFTAFDPDGEVLLHASLAEGTFSYRAVLAEWTGRPAEPPTAAVDGSTVLASWNGATDVARWRVLSGPDPSRLTPGEPVDRTGFETTLEVPDGSAFVAVEALDERGAPLGRSKPVRI